VVAVPLFIVLFKRINAYYDRVAISLGINKVPPAPEGRDTIVIVPIINVSLLTSYAMSEALSLGQEVVAVTVVADDGDVNEQRGRELAATWDAWNPGIALTVLHTDYTSVVSPICAFIDKERRKGDRQLVVLIPVLVPAKLRYRILHNQLDVTLSRALRKRTDVIVARVQMPFPPLPPPRRRRPAKK
jgi:hypothetical protein